MHILKIVIKFHELPDESGAFEKAEAAVHQARSDLLKKALNMPHVKEAARISKMDGYGYSGGTAEIDGRSVVVSVPLDIRPDPAEQAKPTTPPAPVIPRINLDTATFNTLMHGKLLTDEQKARLVLSQLGAAAQFIIGVEEKP